jgi:hypothetical protein
MTRFGLALAIGTSIAPSAASAQTQTPAPPAAAPAVGPPIRRIATASALSTEQLGAVTGVLELRDGRVLGNEGTRWCWLAMDTTLSKVEVVLDSLSESANTYGTRAGTLIQYRGDTTLFIDPVSYAMIVLDPQAKIARVRSVWRIQDLFLFTAPSGFYGWPATDAKGRVVYRVFAQPAPPKVAPPAGVPYFPPDPDSAFIVGMNLDTRKLDTLGSMRIPKTLNTIRQTAEGYFSFYSAINPLPSTDDWAVLSDGTVAFVRGRDYRIEYLNADGSLTSSPKLPFDWQRLSEEDKQRIVDSVKTVNQRTNATAYVGAMIRWVNMFNKAYPPKFSVPDGYVPPNGFSKDWKLPPGVKMPANYIYACAPGVEPTMLPIPGAATTGATPASAAAATPPAPMAMPGMPPGTPPGIPSCIPGPIMMTNGMSPPPPTMRDVSVLPASDLPDYRPPFATATTRADADGNLWIRTIPSKPIPGGPVYDIVSRQGELTDRIQLPPGYTLVGFGKGKVVFLSMRDAKGIHLARVRLR